MSDAKIAVTVIRHPRERIAKCSLRLLHARPDLTFVKGKPSLRFDATGFVLLAVDAPVLSRLDGNRPLLLLDSTWRWLPQLRAQVVGTPLERSLPADVVTAYPRVSRLFQDPAHGLASVEALYVAKRILGDEDPSLLDGYPWQQQFLAQFAAIH